MTRLLKRRWWVLVFPSALLLALLAGFWWGERIEVARIHLPIGTQNMPLRVAVISDIHIGAGGFGMNRWKRTLSLVEREKPDVVLLLGDYVSSHRGIPALKEVLQGVRAPMGVYAVLGNHDHWAGAEQIVRILKEHHVEVLVNRAVPLRRSSGEIWLVGIDDLWSGKPDWQKAFDGVPRGAPVILLSHNPDAMLAPQRERVSLILSGHTHGGHIWLPLARLLGTLSGRAFIPHSEYGLRHPHGLRREGDTWIYVTKGVTVGNRLPRWYNAREVVILEVGHPSAQRDAR
ncbi:MAG: metallophosphoesterase [Chthonomonadetes bacterium]|nr:metallophosphoesterase [Chthonomonadetes bacterium]